MNTLINWLGPSFAPKIAKTMDKKTIRIPFGALMANAPILLPGSIISIHSPLTGYVSFLPDLPPVYNFSFGIVSLTLVFLTGYHGTKKYRFKDYGVPTGLIALMMFFMVIESSIADFQLQVALGRFGGSGMASTSSAGTVTTVISNLYFEPHLFEDSVSLPDPLICWPNQVIPGVIVLVLTTILIYWRDIGLSGLITKPFSPLISIGQTYPGFMFCIFIPAFFYSLGANSWLMNPIASSIDLARITADAAAFEQGPQLTNIYTSNVIFSVIFTGGMGMTLTLNITTLKSRGERIRRFGQIAMIPSLFNINEPLVHGAPVALSPVSMILMWISALVLPTITWLALSSGPAMILRAVANMGQLSVPICSFLATYGDFRAVILVVGMFLLSWLIW